MDVSVVIAAWNERENLVPVVTELAQTLARDRRIRNHEIIVVDDGSSDGSPGLLRTLDLPALRTVFLSRRSGQTAAVRAGIRAARYDVVVTMDADGQDDPRGIGPLLASIEAGADAAVGERTSRRDTALKRAASRAANAIRRLVLGDPFLDIGCSLRAFRRRAARRFPPWPGAHRFFPYFVWRGGGRVDRLPVEHRPRMAGRSHYGILGRAARGLVLLARVSSEGARAPRPPVVSPAGVVAAAAIVAFLAAGLIANGDWGWTRDGGYTMLRAKTNLAILRHHVTGDPAPTQLDVMKHPALPATVAGVVARAASPVLSGWSPPSILNLPFFLWNTAGLALLYFFVRRFFSAAAAAAAVVLLAAFPRFIAAAHMYHKDTPIMVAGLIAVWAALEARERGTAESTAVAGLASGLAVSFHYFGVLFVPIGAALMVGRRPGRDAAHVALFLANAAAAFLVLNPVLWQDWRRIVVPMRAWTGDFWRWREWYLGLYQEARELPWHYSLVHFLAATPILHLVAFAAGLRFLWRPLTPAAVALAAWFAVPVAILSWPGVTRYDGFRHLFLVMPAVAAISGVGVVAVYRRVGPGLYRRLTVVIGLVALALPVRDAFVLHPYQEGYVNEAAIAACGNRLMRRLYLFDYDAGVNRAMAWLEEHAAEGSSVLTTGFETCYAYPSKRGIRQVTQGPSDYRLARRAPIRGYTRMWSEARHGIVIVAVDRAVER